MGALACSFTHDHPANLPTFCCPSADMLRIACHCSFCVAATIGRLHARHANAPKALDVGLKDDIT